MCHRASVGALLHLAMNVSAMPLFIGSQAALRHNHSHTGLGAVTSVASPVQASSGDSEDGSSRPNLVELIGSLSDNVESACKTQR